MCPKRQSCPVLPGLIINVQSLWSLRMGVFRSLGGSRPVRLAGYINQDETAILCGVWEFVGQEPNNSVYLAPIGFADVVLSSILLLISYHTPILMLCGEIGLAVAHFRNRLFVAILSEVSNSISTSTIQRIRI